MGVQDAGEEYTGVYSSAPVCSSSLMAERVATERRKGTSSVGTFNPVGDLVEDGFTGGDVADDGFGSTDLVEDGSMRGDVGMPVPTTVASDTPESVAQYSFLATMVPLCLARLGTVLYMLSRASPLGQGHDPRMARCTVPCPSLANNTVPRASLTGTSHFSTSTGWDRSDAIDLFHTPCLLMKIVYCVVSLTIAVYMLYN